MTSSSPKKMVPMRESGSVLLASMIFVLGIAAFLVSYLWLVENSNQSIARAQRWNAALAVAEAGIEEGLANLNVVAITTSSNANTFAGFTHNLGSDTYSVSSAASGVVATITSSGNTIASITGDTITRTVQVTAQRQALFSKGMVAMTDITMNGNGIISDSFNSYNTNQSLNGKYNYNYYHGTNGDIASVNGLVDVGNHTISGDLYLGPNSTYVHGPNGGVTGTIYNDWNMQFPDVFLPTNDINGNQIVWTPAPGSSSSHTFTNSGYYTISDDGDLTVKPGVKVILDVKPANYSLSDMNIQGGTTNSGTIVMYQETGSLSLGGNASSGAANSRAENFAYFGLPGVTSINMSGNTTFTGVIYAPRAAFTLGGGGSNYNFIGSLVAYSITVNGNFNLHYDESLIGLYFGYYAVGSWKEL